jgi:DNA-binding XRE family transcriptional regulator
MSKNTIKDKLKKPSERITRILSSNIRTFREIRGLSQEALAEMCSLHRTYIGSVEREKSESRNIGTPYQFLIDKSIGRNKSQSWPYHKSSCKHYPHHITQRGNRRQNTFFCDDDYRRYIQLMAEWCGKCGVEIWAYCLMPKTVFAGRQARRTGATRVISIFGSNGEVIYGRVGLRLS